jgi:hypothetical protein
MLERCTVLWVLTAVNPTLSGNNITLNANNNIHTVGVDIQADNSIVASKQFGATNFNVWLGGSKSRGLSAVARY